MGEEKQKQTQWTLVNLGKSIFNQLYESFVTWRQNAMKKEGNFAPNYFGLKVFLLFWKIINLEEDYTWDYKVNWKHVMSKVKRKEG